MRTGKTIVMYQELISSILSGLEAYKFAEKEKNKQIKDKINALKSKLAEEKRQKLTKTINQERAKELEAQIKILQELCG